MPRPGHGKKDGSRKGIKSGGRGKNRTSKCRHSKKNYKEWWWETCIRAFFEMNSMKNH